MEQQALNLAKKAGNWISAILLGNTRELIARIDERTNFMLEDIKDIKPKVADMFPKLDILWKDKIAPANSPRQLNSRGQAILDDSGIKEIIDAKKDELLKLVQSKNTTNPYDAEKVISEIMMELPIHCPDVVESLKQGAFQSGVDINTVLFAGSIYLRNLIFPDLGFSLEDLDKPKSN